MKKFRIFFLFFMFLVASFGFCQNSPYVHGPTLIPHNQIPHLDKLQAIVDIGILKIGNIDLVKIISEAKKLKVYYNFDGDATEQDRSRKSAWYSYLKKEVYFNRTVIAEQRPKNQREVDLDSTLYFHEYLGALGYDDRNYQISSVLTLTHLQVELAHLRSHFLVKLNVWKKYLAQLHFEKIDRSDMQIKSGGSTTTEGGGDYSAAQFKYMILYHLMFESENLEHFKAKELSIIQFILDLKMEVDWGGRHTADQLISMKLANGHWMVWLPRKFVLETAVHARNFNHPDYILRNIIRPVAEAQPKILFRRNVRCESLIAPRP